MNNKPRYFLCHLDELANPGSRGERVIIGDTVQNVFIVRVHDLVYGYLNSCPHTGGPLDWVPGQFLSKDRQHIQCATHDALFHLDSGTCVAGPCTGDRLTTVPLQLESGNVYLLTDNFPWQG